MKFVTISKRKKNSIYGKTTKDIAIREASMSHKRKGTEVL